MTHCKYCKHIMKPFHRSKLTNYKHWYCDKCHAHCTIPEGQSETWRSASEWFCYVNYIDNIHRTNERCQELQRRKDSGRTTGAEIQECKKLTELVLEYYEIKQRELKHWEQTV